MVTAEFVLAGNVSQRTSPSQIHTALYEKSQSNYIQSPGLASLSQEEQISDFSSQASIIKEHVGHFQFRPEL